MAGADPENLKPVTIFISSPGDVIPERIRLEQAVDRLRTEFRAHLDLKTVRWEELPLSATEHFQSQIPRPSSADVVVVVFWWRLGTPLRGRVGWPHEWDGPLSGGEVTGTEWEFEEAVHGARARGGKPVVLVYQKRGIPRFTSEQQIGEYLSEKQRVDAFIARWFRDRETGAYGNAWREFSDEAEFAEMVDDHLRGLLREEITADGGGGDVRWPGSPFRGLASYGVDDAPIFFGRTRAQLRLRALAEGRATARSPWVLVTGASGGGKSSLVLAGLLTDVRKPGLVAGVGEARYVVVRPSDADGRPLRALVEGLLGEHGLPELGGKPLLYETERLRELLTAGGAEAAHAITQGLTVVGSRLSEPYRPLLVVVVDQLEELFRLPADRHKELIAALDGLSAVDGVWIVATIRSDFLQQLDRHPLGNKFDPEGRYLLGPPTQRELGQIITRPAALAGLSWETDENGLPLDEQLQLAAGRDPAALPLLGYVLEQLWYRRKPGGALVFDAYRALGGLEGAIGSRAEEVFATVPAAAQAALPRVLARLVTVGQGDDAQPVAESAALDRFVDGSPERTLVDALLAPDARLLVASEGTVRVAHEAVLTHWRRAAAQLETDRRDIQLIARLREQAERWRGVADEQQRVSLLLTPGLPLTEAEDLLAHRGDELDDEVIALIKQSVEFWAAAREAELVAERARRQEAEWGQLVAQKLERRATAEEYYARAMQTRDRADQVEERRHDDATYAMLLRHRAHGLEEAAAAAMVEAYRLHRDLAEHPGAPHRGGGNAGVAGQGTAGRMFSLEVLPAAPGSCFLIHYGSRVERHLVIVDGGDRSTWQRVLKPSLRELMRRSDVQRLSLELVLVTQYDMDSAGGIVSMLEDLIHTGSVDIAIKRLWFNNFQTILPPGAASPVGPKPFKWRLHDAARALDITVNAPFDRFVMPADIGPARVPLAGGLEVTVVAPPNQRVVKWYFHWLHEQEKQGVSAAAVRNLEAGINEFASSAELSLIRRPPVPYHPPVGHRMDVSSVNMSSVVVHLSFGGRSMLLTSDSRADLVMTGLFDAWLLDPERGMDVDLMLIPHCGSDRNVTRQFLEQVRAGHYVVIAAPRFRLPNAATIEMLGAARRDAGALYVGGKLPQEQADRLSEAADRAGIRPPRFPEHDRASMMIDLLDPVEPTLS